jgi:hypothetical protein
MLKQLRGSSRITVAGDKGYDTAGFVAGCRELNVTPHVAQNERRPGGSALDQRTTVGRDTRLASASASGWRRFRHLTRARLVIPLFYQHPARLLRHEVFVSERLQDLFLQEI